jgi:hypothetical protein
MSFMLCFIFVKSSRTTANIQNFTDNSLYSLAYSSAKIYWNTQRQKTNLATVLICSSVSSPSFSIISFILQMITVFCDSKFVSDILFKIVRIISLSIPEPPAVFFIERYFAVRVFGYRREFIRVVSRRMFFTIYPDWV